MMTPARCFRRGVSTMLVVLLLSSLVVTDAVTQVQSKGSRHSSGKPKKPRRTLQSNVPIDLVTVPLNHDGKGKGGKSKKSQAPSGAPSISSSPTISASPSESPTRSPAPSAGPSPAPSAPPTFNPTQAPTSSSPTESPTISISPTAAPVTGSPTTASPTPLPFDTVGRVVDATGDVERFSECTNAVPDSATAVADVVLNFDYHMFLTVSADPAVSMAQVEARSHPLLAANFLDCRFDGDTAFEVRAISSLPVDQVFQECAAEDEVSDQDCWIINAGITVEIFFLTARRALQEIDANVISQFGDFLTALFRDGALIETDDDLVALEFVGFTTGQQTGTFDATDVDTGTDAGTTGTVAGVTGAQPADVGNKTVVWSSLLVVGAAVCLVVVGILAVRRRKGGKDTRELADMVVLDDDLSEGSSYYHGSYSRGKDGRQVPEQSGNRVHVLSDMEGYDDNRTEGGNNFDPQWSPRAFGEDNFNPPTFVATDHNRNLSLKSLRSPRSPPNGYASRAYVSSDTVDL